MTEEPPYRELKNFGDLEVPLTVLDKNLSLHEQILNFSKDEKFPEASFIRRGFDVVIQILEQGREQEFALTFLNPETEKESTLLLEGFYYLGGEDQEFLNAFFFQGLITLIKCNPDKNISEVIQYLETTKRPEFASFLTRMELGESFEDRLISDQSFHQFMMSYSDQSFILEYLTKFSRRMMTQKTELWDDTLFYLLKWRNSTFWYHKDAYPEIQFQMNILRPAVNDPEGRHIAEAVLESENFSQQATLLTSGLKSSNHRVKTLSEYFFENTISDDTADQILKRLGKAKEDIQRNELFLRRKILSPYGLELLNTWFSESRCPQCLAVYSASSQWKDSALDLIFIFSNRIERDQDGEKMRVDAIAKLSSSVHLSKDAEKILKDPKRAIQLLSALKASSEFSEKTSLEILEWLPLSSKSSTFDFNNKNRRLLNEILSYYVSHFSRLSPDLYPDLFQRIEVIFELPPDKATDEILLMLLKNMKESSVDLKPKIEVFLEQMK
ncbi:MAG: hypothetical protein J0L93_08900 [Deltaproteobacteria bacterium]|nr:hypothetical protein [Deltaproteobacteria bacterium]